MAHASERKHRHDTGNPDHGAVTTELLTRGLQGVLAAAIAGTFALVVWAIWVAG